ncbi:SgcJ/EcaC family oxidoreductase [Pseudoduganella ginsengisoli]|uniref:SgcJ/EcaC family oxidoreductase n=1 Tax=Pseudoduganella ginsengisoli TaxID=1462440 RepID=A0A6L6PWK5_9BURK|nr:SgcJ/EcaC family oxidoreductase [Pseudoduganella ginsengisoli]MTW01805.1 SgcJ/EcaC family oxidoreductase [Pseudoduganella ginsengisoli]
MTHGNDEQAIRAVIAQWMDATRLGNVDAVLPLMTEDVVFMVPGQPPMTGRDSFAAGMRGMATTHRVMPDSVVEEVAVSGDMAYCRTRLEVRIEPLGGGAAVRRAGYTLSVFRRSADGQWQLARDANLLAPVTDGMSDG